VKQCEATSRRATAIEGIILGHNKGKRKIVDNVEVEKGYKFKEYSLVEKLSLAIEAKRKQCHKRTAQRQIEKNRMVETMKGLQELKE